MATLKKWTAIAVVIMAALLTSCQKDEVYQTYVNSYTKDYTVTTKNWQIGTDDSGNYFYCEIPEPALTDEVYDYGTMQAFILMDGYNISPLPFNDYWIDENNYMWTEQATCEFRPGTVRFILKYSDHATDVQPSYDTYNFRVRFMW